PVARSSPPPPTSASPRPACVTRRSPARTATASFCCGSSDAPDRAQIRAPSRAAPGTLPAVIRPVLGAHSRAFLKSLAHRLAPVVQVGTEGISPEVVRATSIALEDHELIKVKLGQGFTGERLEAAEELAGQTGATTVQVIGRVLVLYRRRAR